MGKDSYMTEAPLKERVEADHVKTATQLKAEHAKEDAALKAEEAQKTAALKAEHAKTPGKTGFFAKLTGHQDPIKKAENEQLKAEIARAEQTTKAEHDFENAELNARKRKENAAIDAVDSFGNNTRANTGYGNTGSNYNTGTNTNFGSNTGYGNTGSNFASNTGSGFGTQGGVNDYGAAGLHHGNIDKAYNHATGARGLAAFADNGLHHEGHHHSGRTETGHHIDGSNAGTGMGNSGFNNGGAGMMNAGGIGQPMATQTVGAMPVAAAAVPMAMPAAPVAATPFVAGAAPATVITPDDSRRY